MVRSPKLCLLDVQIYWHIVMSFCCKVVHISVVYLWRHVHEGPRWLIDFVPSLSLRLTGKPGRRRLVPNLRGPDPASNFKVWRVLEMMGYDGTLRFSDLFSVGISAKTLSNMYLDNQVSVTITCSGIQNGREFQNPFYKCIPSTLPPKVIEIIFYICHMYVYQKSDCKKSERMSICTTILERVSRLLGTKS
jgi:hypothetical protein